MSFFLPCLLERWGNALDGRGQRAVKSSWEDVRRDVIRNLEWLLNTEAPQQLDGIELPEAVQQSVIGFGVPVYSGRTQSTMAPRRVAEEIRRRIMFFEPRIHPDHLEVLPLVEPGVPHFNTLKFSVQGYLRANPLQEFEVRTELDLETGQAKVIA
ncbi:MULTISPECIES: type VI secretion system baseplate subunit TssE [Inhella]|uniref:GPW/gp25 family protein n=1 Tax=Inhella proteolytica TaxID=2795029 RepID=A0A931J3R4_9BURK|nr:GPW/gp25 family protein [Inhella proteolytica]MBH9577736.1 GPW/gp25 family protein [Inhella proteolytica]